MIVFSTKNSRYRVDVVYDLFVIEKVHAFNPESAYLAVGEAKVSKSISLEIGRSAKFDDWETSEVTEIEEVS